MSAKYIVRFDDICPTMDWVVWEKIEAMLLKHNIKPILAVVPDNRDPKLTVDTPRNDFWERVRAWQAAGWTIAIHGYQHVYSTPHAGLMGINHYSEFAGLSYEEQYHKLEQGLAIFAEHNVRADAWIAPAHAFDTNTVRALLALKVDVISDGYYWRPVKRLGALWIPQQLWRFRQMPFGLWTVCLHHNRYTEAQLKNLEANFDEYASAIISFAQGMQEVTAQEINFLDYLMEVYWRSLLYLKARLWPVANQIKKLLGK